MATEDRRLSIGELARATGLTAKALRHYDAVGLLRPESVDPANGYRRYTADQIGVGQLVRRLRDLELPVDEVRRLLDLLGDEQLMVAALDEHRRRLDARATRVRRQLHDLDHLIAERSWANVNPNERATVVDPTTERRLATELFNQVWRLLEREDRTEAEDAEMVHAAHASCFHWMQVGEPVHRARGEWQCARVYAVLGQPEASLRHARSVLDICRREGIGDFDLAFAYEALARAHTVAGDSDEARRWADQARAACADIADEADREIVLADLETATSR